MFNFEVGQQVVCIDDSDLKIDQGKYLKKGQIYTIRWIGPCVVPTRNNSSALEEVICVRLVGITRGMFLKRIQFEKAPLINDMLKAAFRSYFDNMGVEEDYWDDLPFRAERFKPLESKKNELEVFDKLLNPKVKEKV